MTLNMLCLWSIYFNEVQIYTHTRKVKETTCNLLERLVHTLAESEKSHNMLITDWKTTEENILDKYKFTALKINYWCSSHFKAMALPARRSLVQV